MSATRTQVYFTAEQRRALDARARREGTTMAQIVREAVEAYLASEPGEFDAVIERTFGVAPDLEVPSRHEDRDLWNERDD